MRSSVLAVVILFTACSKSSSPQPTESPEPTGEETPTGQEKPAAHGNDDQRPSLTAAACEGQGGKVVGDIGDGAIHRPEYRCPDSGEPPIGSIVADPGGPVAVEGSVCCK